MGKIFASTFQPSPFSRFFPQTVTHRQATQRALGKQRAAKIPISSEMTFAWVLLIVEKSIAFLFLTRQSAFPPTTDWNTGSSGNSNSNSNKNNNRDVYDDNNFSQFSGHGTSSNASRGFSNSETSSFGHGTSNTGGGTNNDKNDREFYDLSGTGSTSNSNSNQGRDIYNHNRQRETSTYSYDYATDRPSNSGSNQNSVGNSRPYDLQTTNAYDYNRRTPSSTQRSLRDTTRRSTYFQGDLPFFNNNDETSVSFRKFSCERLSWRFFPDTFDFERRGRLTVRHRHTQSESFDCARRGNLSGTVPVACCNLFVGNRKPQVYLRRVVSLNERTDNCW